MNRLIPLFLLILFVFSAHSSFAFGKREDPNVDLQAPAPRYLSPKEDGVAQATFTVGINLYLSSKEGYVPNYGFFIRNQAGETVREKVNEETKPKARVIDSIIIFFSGAQQHTLIKELQWDGKNDEGSIVPDGTYVYWIWVVDDKQKRVEKELGEVVIDTKAPAVTLDSRNLVFSPNGDGNLDALTIPQSGSEEALWEGAILDTQSSQIRTFRWKGEPENLDWDGNSTDGNPAPDGMYTYRISSTDEAGNSTTEIIEGITLDTRDISVSVVPDKNYFSPNGDGIKDIVLFSINISDTEGITSGKFHVLNESGETVKTLEWERDIPSSLEYDGLSEDGDSLPEGLYQALLSLEFVSGIKPQSPPVDFTLDISPPSATASMEYGVFSPNSDGNKDSVLISQSTQIVEGEWKGAVTDSRGKEVFAYRWEKTTPEQIVWNGENEQGNMLPDGVYGYSLTATDLAGNTGESEKLTLQIDTRATPLTLGVDTQHFSPNSDKRKDTVTFEVRAGRNDGIESWSLEVLDTGGKTVRYVTGGENQPIPSRITFDGLDDGSKRLPEGKYTGYIQAVYINGNMPEAESPEITLDVTAPRLSLAFASRETPLFSPDRDGISDTISFVQTTDEAETWTGNVKSAAGRTVKTFSWKGKAPSKFDWDGDGNNGAVQADGIYSYVLEGTDNAGNTASASVQGIQLDITPPLVELTLLNGINVFSPDGDGKQDNITIIQETSEEESWKAEIRNAAGKILKSYNFGKKAPRQIVWDGRSDEGLIQLDGNYSYAVTGLGADKKTTTETITDIRIDTVYPEISISLASEKGLFSPDGNGINDTVIIIQKATESGNWTGLVKDSLGKTVRSFTWTDKPVSEMEWDGRSDNGKILPDGVYSYILSGSDLAMHSVTETLENIRIDTEIIPLNVLVSSSGFSPNGDGSMDLMVFMLQVPPIDSAVTSWKFEVKHQDSEASRVFTNDTSEVESMVIWDGLNEGVMMEEGLYRGMFSIDYESGKRAEFATDHFILDISPPVIDLTMAPVPFSPDDDGVDDILFVTARIEDLSPIGKWEANVYDQSGSLFVRVSGISVPAETIEWNGKAIEGDLVEAAVDYTLAVTLRDVFGNQSQTKRNISIDALVTRIGDRLKIRTTDINFHPDSPEYLNLEPRLVEESKKTLQRIARILSKFPAYRIRIEGHANNMSWNVKGDRDIEQLEELMTLSFRRSLVIKETLVEFGLNGDNIDVYGFGGSLPVAPFRDKDERWKNRRVEFTLIKD